MAKKEDVDVRRGMRTVRLSLAAGRAVKTHHSAMTVVVVCTSGRGRFVVNGLAQPLHPGKVICMAPLTPHSLAADEDLELVVVHAQLAAD